MMKMKWFNVKINESYDGFTFCAHIVRFCMWWGSLVCVIVGVDVNGNSGITKAASI